MAILDFTTPTRHPHPHPHTRNEFVAQKLVGSVVLLQSLRYIGQNLGIPQIQDANSAAILDLASRWPPKHNFNTRNGFVTLKLVGLEVLL